MLQNTVIDLLQGFGLKVKAKGTLVSTALFKFIQKRSMKKKFALLIAGSILGLTAFSQKIVASKVPLPIKESFAKQFPGISPKWEKEDGKYEASFKQDNYEMSALFEASGNMTESEIEISVAELPQLIKNYIKTHYSNAAIKEAAKITTANGKIEYEAALKGKDIIFDINGNFIKEVIN